VLTRWMRSQVKRGLRQRGYELKEFGSPPLGFAASLDYAKSRGLAPRTVFDVGVGRGTPWLYEAFGDAKLVLFEPLAVFEAELLELVRCRGADWKRVALSNRPGTSEFNYNVAFPTSSSLYDIDPGFARFATIVQREHHFERVGVDVDTLDRLNGYEPPYVIKLDVEGAEMRVLEGAKETLRRTEFLIAEISVMRRLSDEPTFAETIAYLDGCGFELFDIPSVAQVRPNGQLLYLDAAFVPKGSALWPRDPIERHGQAG
jgi:FkbM family methyltransferase